MHELKRRAYLEAIGIQSYISRAPLPGAMATQKLMIVRSERETPADNTSPGDAFDSVMQMPGLDSAVPGSKQSPRLKSAAPNRESVPSFSLTAIVAGNWLWLEQLPEKQALLSDQVLLVQAMSRALGWGSNRPESSQFNWPLHENRQLDQGPEAARAGLGGFLHRQLELGPCKGVVLLGEGSQKWVSPELLGGAVCVGTVATLAMLKNPALKKQAWQDLRPHAL